MTIIAEVALDAPHTTRWPGLLGELDLISACLAGLGIEASFSQLTGLTGVGMRAHFFRPRDNPGTLERPEDNRPDSFWSPRYAWSSLRHTNYGHVEAIAYFYGVEIKPLQPTKTLDAWQAIRFELDEGRPLIAYDLLAPGVPSLIVGYRLHKNPLAQRLLVRDLAGGIAEINLTGRAQLSMEGALFPNELLLVRPGQLAPWRGGDLERYADALRWMSQHQRMDRELIYETSRFYATGPRAFEAFAEFLTERAPEELADPIAASPEETPRALGRFAQEIAAQWWRSRAAFAEFARALAARLEAAGHPPLADLKGGAPALLDLADVTEATAEALIEVSSLLEGDPATIITHAPLREAAARAVLDAQERQRDAATALRALCA